MQRYFITGEHKSKLELNNTEIIHHMAVVMRNKPGEKISIVANEKTAIYEIIEINNEQVLLQQIEFVEQSNELAINVDIALGFLKKDNFELSIQKVVELGINQVIPALFTRNVVKVNESKWKKKQKRYQDIMENAAQQSRRNVIPQICNYKKLQEIDYSKYDLVLVCYEAENKMTLLDLQNQIKASEKILYLIGPEGGITEAEIDFLKKQANVQIISLGKRILRAETAAIITMANLAMIIEEN